MHEPSNIVFVNATTVREAADYFFSCEACNEEEAQFPFDNVLDEITGHDPSVTDYVLAEPGQCPCCEAEVHEKTLVEWYPR